MRSALITGGSGFIGSRLARRLAHVGCDVHLLLRTHSSLRLLGEAASAMSVHRCAEDPVAMLALLAEVRPDVVFHLASQFTASHRPEQVGALVDANVRFPAQLLEAMARAGISCLVNAGTVWQHFEQADYDPVCLYAATKQSFADLLRYYIEAEGIHAVTLELTDTYGPGDPRPKLLSVLRRIAVSGERLAMSSGEQFIDLVHVEDVVSGFIDAAIRLLATSSGAASETFAIRSREPLQLRDLAALCERIWQHRLDIQWGGRPYRTREVMEPWRGGVTLPGWTPRIGLADGLLDLAPTITE